MPNAPASLRKRVVQPSEAAEILRNIADRNEQALGDLEQLGYDQRALVESSGDLDLIEALRLGAASLILETDSSGG